MTLLFLSPVLAEPPPPEWIWTGQDRDGASTAAAERRFSAEGEIERATLRATADFSALSVSLNGKPVIALDPYDPPAEIDVSRLITHGENVIAVSAAGFEGPSAIGVSIEITRKSADPVIIATGPAWETKTGGSVVSLGTIDPRRWALNRLPDISPFSEYNQWKESLSQDGGKPPADNTRFSPLPEGFEIAKVRDAGEGEDSWVSLAIDPKGRLVIAKEQKGLLRLTLSDNGNEVVSAETIDDTLQECRGLAWKGDALYAYANRSKGLYRLRDTDGDDRFDETRLLLTTDGGAGHGRNDLVVGPGGALYAIQGDDILVPEASPRRARPEPGAPKELGHSARLSESDESVTWTALNRGLRNPYGIDFNRDGESFTYDADNEGDVGLPFYRPTRINHLVSGANYGWHQDRGNSRSIPVYAPDTVPTTYDVGRGSPTGVKFGERSHFPQPWKEALFALDWAYGRLIATHLTPNGASYLGSGEVFLEGRPLNVTDLDFDADGAMWFVTGGRKTQSALYRVRYTGKREPVSEPGAQAAASAAFSEKARGLRRQLERFHGGPYEKAIDEAWPHLGSPDPWIRNAARVAVEWQPVDQWRKKALAMGSDLGGLTARLALARAGSDEDRAAVAESAARLDLNGATRTEKLTLLRLYEIAGVPSVLRKPVAAQLIALAPDPSEPVNRELTRGLIALDSPEAVTFTLDRLASADDQSERLHYLEALGDAKTGWTTDQRKTFFNTLAHANRFSNGDRFMLPFFQSLEMTALSHVPDETEREKLASLLMEAPDDTPPPPPRKTVRQWTLADFPPESESSPARKPDLARGRELYSAVLCARCHVCGPTGRPAGPDLSTVASRFSRRDLLESIIEPSNVVAEVHRNVIVTRTDGTLVQGRIVQDDFRESKLILSTNPFAPGELVTIPKGEIRSWEESPVSPMPPALLDSLTREEIDDLVGFILSGGKEG